MCNQLIRLKQFAGKLKRPFGKNGNFAGIDHIRQMDPAFNENRFADLCTDFFFRIQGAWINRNMSSVRGILTDEMFGKLNLRFIEIKLFSAYLHQTCHPISIFLMNEPCKFCNDICVCLNERGYFGIHGEDFSV